MSQNVPDFGQVQGNEHKARNVKGKANAMHVYTKIHWQDIKARYPDWTNIQWKAKMSEDYKNQTPK